MKLLFISFLVIALAICFTTDPTPTVPKTQPIRQLINISIIFSFNNNNNKNDKDKNEGGKHLCTRCNLHSLTFE